jgi:hypothetical protein
MQMTTARGIERVGTALLTGSRSRLEKQLHEPRP